MEHIRFAQLCDTHIGMNNGEAVMMGPVFEKLPNTVHSLEAALQVLAKQELDFVLFCGDLVHEGSAEDYRLFKHIVDEQLKDIPAIFCLGNHDRKKAFWEGCFGKNSESPYYVEQNIKGLRILSLDSACGGEVFGAFAAEEYDWLEKVLKEPAPQGTILVFHHPVAWDVKELSMTVAPRFRELLRESDVRAVFCGHTHENDLRFLEGVPQVTGDSTAFGCSYIGNTMGFTDKATYNLCTLGENGLTVRNKLLNPAEHIALEIDILELMRAVKQGE